MGRPLAQLTIFFAIASVIVSLAYVQPLPGEDTVNNTTISEDQATLEATPQNETTDFGFDSCQFRLFGFNILNPVTPVCQFGSGIWHKFVKDSAVGKAITTVTAGLGDFVRLMGTVLTFNVPGAPAWIRWPIGFSLTTIASYIVVSLVRGAG